MNLEVSRRMDKPIPQEPIQSIAIVGFPNTGKTALKTHLDEACPEAGFEFLEFPGIVMLGRNTPEEGKTYDYLLGRACMPPSGIIATVDASELDRQLYLVFQLIDLRLPMLLCITGDTDARRKGTQIDAEKLSSALGIKVLRFPEERSDVHQVLTEWTGADNEKVKRQPMHWRPSMALADAYQHLDTCWIHKHLHLYTGARLVEGLRLLTVPNAAQEYEAHPAYKALLKSLEEARKILEERNEKWTTTEIIQRSKWIGQTLQVSVAKLQDESASIRTGQLLGQLWRNWFVGR